MIPFALVKLRNLVSDLVSVVYLRRRETIDRKYYNCVLTESRMESKASFVHRTGENEEEKMSVQASSACAQTWQMSSRSIFEIK